MFQVKTWVIRIFWICVIVGLVLLILWAAGVLFQKNNTNTINRYRVEDGFVKGEFRLINTIMGRMDKFGFPAYVTSNGLWMVTKTPQEILLYKNISLEGSDFEWYKTISFDIAENVEIFYVAIQDTYVLVGIHKKSAESGGKEFYRIMNWESESYTDINCPHISTEDDESYEIGKGLFLNSHELILGFVGEKSRKGLVGLYQLEGGVWSLYQTLRSEVDQHDNQFGLAIIANVTTIMVTCFSPHQILIYTRMNGEFYWQLTDTIILYDTENSVFSGVDLYLSADSISLLISDPYRNMEDKYAVGAIDVYTYNFTRKKFEKNNTIYPRYKYDGEMFGVNMSIFLNILVVGCYDKDQYIKHLEIYLLKIPSNLSDFQLQDVDSGEYKYSQTIDWPFKTSVELVDVSGGSISFFEKNNQVFMINGYNSDVNSHSNGMITIYSTELSRLADSI